MSETETHNQDEGQGDVYADRLRVIEQTFRGLRSANIEGEAFLSIGELALTILNDLSQSAAIMAGIELERHAEEAVKEIKQERKFIGKKR